MKTNQEMTRYIDNFSVIQRTSDGYFDGSELLRQWNNVDGNSRRRMSEFVDSPKTKEFLKALAIDESHRSKSDIGENQLLIKVNGRNTKHGKTPDKVWMNPLLFIKFAMWINPTFEVKVLRFVYDEMIKYRNDAGDAYKELCSAVMRIVPSALMKPSMSHLAKGLNHLVFGNHESMMRNKIGDESKQRELWEMERKLADLINDGFINSFDALISYLRKKWIERYQPEVLSPKSIAV